MGHEAWITRHWQRDGIAWVIVARERSPGAVTAGAFLLDLWCLGVKDAYVEEDLSRAELEEIVDAQLPGIARDSMAPAGAKALIEGAVAFAQSHGFLPHRDFRKARKVLNGLDASSCAEAFTFGHDGRVHYVAGPSDDDARVRRVLAVLDAKFGPEGFDFTPYVESDDGEYDDDALDQLFRFLESERCPVPGQSGFVVSGFVAAAVIIDADRELDEWWTEFFGGEDPELPEDDEFSGEMILDGFGALWVDVHGKLLDEVLVPTLPPLSEPDHHAAAAEYCRGFLQAFDARPELVRTLEQDAGAATALADLRRYAEASAEQGESGRRDRAPLIAAAMRALYAARAVANHPGGPASAGSP